MYMWDKKLMQINSAFTTVCKHGTIYHMFHQHPTWCRMSVLSSPANAESYQQLYVRNEGDVLMGYANNISLPSLYTLSEK